MYLREKYRRPENAYPRAARVTSGLRYYSPTLGRWCSRDPAGERGGKNLFEAFENAPVWRYDSLGMQASRAGTPNGKKDCCCCCPVDITNYCKWIRKDPKKKDEWGHWGRWGYRFYPGVALRWEETGQEGEDMDCEFDWQEWATVPLHARYGAPPLPPFQWHARPPEPETDIFFGPPIDSPETSEFKDRTHRCPGAEAFRFHDTPGMGFDPKRKLFQLFIGIRIRPSQACQAVCDKKNLGEPQTLRVSLYMRFNDKGWVTDEKCREMSAFPGSYLNETVDEPPWFGGK